MANVRLLLLMIRGDTDGADVYICWPGGSRAPPTDPEFLSALALIQKSHFYICQRITEVEDCRNVGLLSKSE